MQSHRSDSRCDDGVCDHDVRVCDHDDKVCDHDERVPMIVR